jgi:hypothetical protein
MRAKNKHTEAALESSLLVAVDNLNDHSLSAGETSLKDDHDLVLAEDGLPHDVYMCNCVCKQKDDK